MASAEILVLGAVLSFVFGWNNSSYLIGSGEGSGSLTLREALLISSAGLFLGAVLEGPKMIDSLSGSVTPDAGGQVVLVALLVSLCLCASLSLVKLPVSFSMAMVGAFAGAAYASALPLNASRLEEVAGFWFLAPVLAALLAFLFYRIILKSAPRLSLLALDGASRYGVILTSFIVAYVLGANNVGLIYGAVTNGGLSSETEIILLVVIAIAGMVALGRGGVSGTVGDRMLGLSPFGVVATFLSSAVLIGLGTQLAIPVSITQCLLGGMFGAALTKQISVVNGRLATESIALWVAVPIGAFILAFVFFGL
jgi:phosphate/sulfate permease